VGSFCLFKVRASFFEKKEAKKLSVLWVVATLWPNPPVAKVFWFFFSKKNRLLLLRYALLRCIIVRPAIA
jgi:hypothetical protein